jgi:hypothetical protein
LSWKGKAPVTDFGSNFLSQISTSATSMLFSAVVPTAADGPTSVMSAMLVRALELSPLLLLPAPLPPALTLPLLLLLLLLLPLLLKRH